jgi:hypothetical protein
MKNKRKSLPEHEKGVEKRPVTARLVIFLYIRAATFYRHHHAKQNSRKREKEREGERERRRRGRRG